MKKRAGDRFRFTPEMGARLRELRLKAGLSQEMLAATMGSRCKGSHRIVSRLENAKMANPGIGLVADYLRACRAGFADIGDLLCQYTSQPTVVESETRMRVMDAVEYLPSAAGRAAERYDRRVARRAELKHEPAPVAAERVRRARSFALSQVMARRVRFEVARILETGHVQTGGPLCEHHLQDYGASVWRILNRTRGGKQAETRAALLADAAKVFLVQGGPKPEHLEAVREGLLEFFQRAEAAGELDS